MILSSFQLSVEKPNQRRPNNQSKQSITITLTTENSKGKTSNLLELLENTNDQVVIVFSFASDKLSGRAA